jgi:integrase/recombinase XerD
MEREISKIFRHLEEIGLEPHPARLGEEEVHAIVNLFPPGAAGNERNRAYHVQLLGVFLKWNGNPILENMDLTFNETPVNSWWLSSEQAEMVKAAGYELGGYYRFMVYCGLELGLRRVGMMRLEVGSFTNRSILVRSKGRGGGKTRELDRPDDLDEELALVLEARQEVVLRAGEAGCKDPVPPNIFLAWNPKRGLQGRNFRGAGRSHMDRLVKTLGTRAGVPELSFHPMRRRYGRDLWLAGVQIETIANILGHVDTKTTIRYLGINLEDQRVARAKLRRFRSNTAMSLLRRVPAGPIPGSLSEKIRGKK